MRAKAVDAGAQIRMVRFVVVNKIKQLGRINPSRGTGSVDTQVLFRRGVEEVDRFVTHDACGVEGLTLTLTTAGVKVGGCTEHSRCETTSAYDGSNREHADGDAGLRIGGGRC